MINIDQSNLPWWKAEISSSSIFNFSLILDQTNNNVQYYLNCKTGLCIGVKLKLEENEWEEEEDGEGEESTASWIVQSAQNQ